MLQIPVWNQAEWGWAVSLSRPSGILYWSVSLTQQGKCNVLFSKERFAEERLREVISWMLHFQLSLFLWSRRCDLPATTTLYSVQVKLNIGLKPENPGRQMPTPGAGHVCLRIWEHVKLQWWCEPNMSWVLRHRIVLVSLDSYFNPFKSSDANDVWKPSTDLPFGWLLIPNNYSLGSQLRLLQAGTFDLIH